MRTLHCDRCKFHEREDATAGSYVHTYMLVAVSEVVNVSLKRTIPQFKADLCQECRDEIVAALKLFMVPAKPKTRKAGK
jgi:hypothetical protein